MGTTVHVRVDLGWGTAITAQLATVATGRLHSLNVHRQMPSLRVEIQSSGSLATSTGSSGGAGMVLIVAEGKKMLTCLPGKFWVGSLPGLWVLQVAFSCPSLLDDPEH